MSRSSLAVLGLAVVGLTAMAACSGRPCSSFFSGSPENARSGGSGDPSPGYSSSGGNSAPPRPEGAAAAVRAITEADIVQLDDEQDRIYAMSRSGSLAIVDAATPGSLSLLGKTSLGGEPFEMYRRGDVLITMSNRAVKGDGSLQAPQAEDAAPRSPDATVSAAIASVDVSNPHAMQTLATFKVPGEIADSRIVGNILYLATYENASCYGCAKEPRTLVTSFDVSTPTAPKQVDQVSFDTNSQAAGFNSGWSMSWKRSIIATTNRLYVGGLAADASTTTDEGVIEVLDISDPTGKLTRGAKVTMAGPIMSRWQMDESNGILRVVSQRGVGRTQNGEKYPDVDTFRIESSTSLVRVGHMTMKLPKQEGLKTVRFDGTRGYAITFEQTDPLFTLDLSNPAQPTQKGELQIPGWVFHLEPRGDKLIGLGLDRTDQTGNLNVSLFDVADLTKPKLVQRVSFGPTNVYTDQMITSGVLAEDQDRIQKSFRIDQDGLIAVPFSGGSSCGSSGSGSTSSSSSSGAGAPTANANSTSGIQLIDWTATSLTKRALLPLAGNPRRAVRRDSATMKELIAVSDSNVRSFTIDQRDIVKQTADVVIGKCVPRPVSPQFGGGGMPGDWEGRGGGGGDYDPSGSGTGSASSCY